MPRNNVWSIYIKWVKIVQSKTVNIEPEVAGLQPVTLLTHCIANHLTGFYEERLAFNGIFNNDLC